MSTPPPDMPACAGADPQLFEMDLFYAQALEYCARCPVRAWCLRQVDPIRNSLWAGVAGGYPWNNGFPNAAYINAQDHVLIAYLNTRPDTRNHQ